MKALKPILALAFGCLLPAAAHAGTICPSISGSGITSTSGCDTLVTIGATGTVSITTVDNHPYDGNDDNLVGVINNYTGGSVLSLTLSGPGNIFGFDNDGICTFSFTGNGYCSNSQKNGNDPQDYQGPDNTFSNINGAATHGTVNFTTPLANGQNTYFSLEGAPTAGGSGITGTIGTTPEPSSLMLLGTGVLGLAGSLRRRFVNA